MPPAHPQAHHNYHLYCCCRFQARQEKPRYCHHYNRRYQNVTQAARTLHCAIGISITVTVTILIPENEYWLPPRQHHHHSHYLSHHTALGIGKKRKNRYRCNTFETIDAPSVFTSLYGLIIIAKTIGITV